MLVEMCICNKEMSWFRNTITNLYNAVLAPVAATRDALAERLQSVRDTASLLYERAKQKLGYGQTLKDILEEQANQDDIGIEDIKHLYPRAKTQTTDNGIEDIKLIASNEPLLGCGPLPDWLRKKRCIHSRDTFDDNLCV